MSMRDERQNQLDALLRMFATKGWELYERELQAAFEQIARSKWLECKTGEELMKAKGEIEQLARVLSFSIATKNEAENFEKLEFEDEQTERTNELED